VGVPRPAHQRRGRGPWLRHRRRHRERGRAAPATPSGRAPAWACWSVWAYSRCPGGSSPAAPTSQSAPIRLGLSGASWASSVPWVARPRPAARVDRTWPAGPIFSCRPHEGFRQPGAGAAPDLGWSRATCIYLYHPGSSGPNGAAPDRPTREPDHRAPTSGAQLARDGLAGRGRGAPRPAPRRAHPRCPAGPLTPAAALGAIVAAEGILPLKVPASARWPARAPALSSPAGNRSRLGWRGVGGFPAQPATNRAPAYARLAHTKGGESRLASYRPAGTPPTSRSVGSPRRRSIAALGACANLGAPVANAEFPAFGAERQRWRTR
jgi:hypothetical protein